MALCPSPLTFILVNGNWFVSRDHSIGAIRLHTFQLCEEPGLDYAELRQRAHPNEAPDSITDVDSGVLARPAHADDLPLVLRDLRHGKVRLHRVADEIEAALQR